MDLTKPEDQILQFWKDKQIYKKSKKKNEKGKKFYMMDGPPYATGHIHIGTALNKISKDIAMRSKRLQGFDVFDRPGYDTHGVPIEFQIEKEIGSKNKKDIEKYGVKKFIGKCKEYATQYIGVMNKEFENLGVWMDFENPYLTLDNSYIESIWDTFKEAEKKGLLYLGKYPVHVCPRCETAVAYNEIEYTKLDDTAIFVKFPLTKQKNKFLIIWTTTPWTLPGNTGIMVNPDIDYAEVEMGNGETWIIAKEKVEELMHSTKRGYTFKKFFKGKTMEGWEYQNPLSKELKLQIKKGYKVLLSSRYVNIEEGTGLVHCAPGHGKEDYEVGKEYGIDMPSPVGINGLLEKETGKYAGKKARIVDSEIIADLDKHGFLVYKHRYSHDYPLCWRCKDPLLMISVPQWFFKIDKIQKKLLQSNSEVNWQPKYMELRMKAWLEGISDWPISRNRYWGTPLPIWKCEKCNQTEVIGSIPELEKKSGKKVKEIHKPEIDEIKWKCSKTGCKGEMKRVTEVLDVWFDAGVSSWAALGYPAKQDLFKKYWPADLNLEGKDQIRGWWNSEIILSEIKFNKKPFDSIMVHGMVLDLGKKKMSKSIGNIISPHEIIEKYGRDYMRYYFAKISKGEDFAFNEEEFKQIRQIFVVLENVIKYLENLDGKETGKENGEDKWILSKFNSTVKEITKSYNEYNFPKAIELFENFLLMDLSRTYIKIIRERENEKIVKQNLEQISTGLLKLIAPVIPFMTEKIWQNLKDKKIVSEESIHLSLLPKVDEKLINQKLEEEFSQVLKIIEIGLRERDKSQIGLRWPLAKVKITSPVKISKDVEKIILAQLNIKKVESKTGKEILIELDTKITPELEAEGYARELSRQIQDFRKKLGLNKRDEVQTVVITDEKFKKILEKNKNFIKDRTNSKKFEIVTTHKETFKNTIDFEIKDKRGSIAIQ